jgi:hypothetical protein
MIFTLPESLIWFHKPNIVLTLVLKIFLILKVAMSAGQKKISPIIFL